MPSHGLPVSIGALKGPRLPSRCSRHHSWRTRVPAQCVSDWQSSVDLASLNGKPGKYGRRGIEVPPGHCRRCADRSRRFVVDMRSNPKHLDRLRDRLQCRGRSMTIASSPIVPADGRRIERRLFRRLRWRIHGRLNRVRGEPGFCRNTGCLRPLVAPGIAMAGSRHARPLGDIVPCRPSLHQRSKGIHARAG